MAVMVVVQVRVLCTQMLYSHPSSRFVLAVLHTLTRLSLRMVIDIPVQVRMLYSHPSSRLLLAVLHTLTRLSLRMVNNIPVQVRCRGSFLILPCHENTDS